MPKPMGKRKTKRTYLGSGAGSLRSGTGATAKAKKPESKIRKRTEEIFRELRTVPIPKKAFRPITPNSPATGLGSVFEKPKRQRRRIATTLRRQAKR